MATAGRTCRYPLPGGFFPHLYFYDKQRQRGSVFGCVGLEICNGLIEPVKVRETLVPNDYFASIDPLVSL